LLGRAVSRAARKEAVAKVVLYRVLSPLSTGSRATREALAGAEENDAMARAYAARSDVVAFFHTFWNVDTVRDALSRMLDEERGPYEAARAAGDLLRAISSAKAVRAFPSGLKRRLGEFLLEPALQRAFRVATQGATQGRSVADELGGDFDDAEVESRRSPARDAVAAMFRCAYDDEAAARHSRGGDDRLPRAVEDLRQTYRHLLARLAVYADEEEEEKAKALCGCFCATRHEIKVLADAMFRLPRRDVDAALPPELQDALHHAAAFDARDARRAVVVLRAPDSFESGEDDVDDSRAIEPAWRAARRARAVARRYLRRVAANEGSPLEPRSFRRRFNQKQQREPSLCSGSDVGDSAASSSSSLRRKRRRSTKTSSRLSLEDDEEAPQYAGARRRPVPYDGEEEPEEEDDDAPTAALPPCSTAQSSQQLTTADKDDALSSASVPSQSRATEPQHTPTIIIQNSTVIIKKAGDDDSPQKTEAAKEDDTEDAATSTLSSTEMPLPELKKDDSFSTPSPKKTEKKKKKDSLTVDGGKVVVQAAKDDATKPKKKKKKKAPLKPPSQAPPPPQELRQHSSDEWDDDHSEGDAESEKVSPLSAASTPEVTSKKKHPPLPPAPVEETKAERRSRRKRREEAHPPPPPRPPPPPPLSQNNMGWPEEEEEEEDEDEKEKEDDDDDREEDAPASSQRVVDDRKEEDDDDDDDEEDTAASSSQRVVSVPTQASKPGRPAPLDTASRRRRSSAPAELPASPPSSNSSEKQPQPQQHRSLPRRHNSESSGLSSNSRPPPPTPEHLARRASPKLPRSADAATSTRREAEGPTTAPGSERPTTAPQKNPFSPARRGPGDEVAGLTALSAPGMRVIKHCRHCRPHASFVSVDGGGRAIRWSSRRRRDPDASVIRIKDVVDVRVGLATPVLLRHGRADKAHLYLSVVTNLRSLDLETTSQADRNDLVAAIEFLRRHVEL